MHAYTFAPAIIGLLAGATAAQNLVINGDFDDNVLADDESYYNLNNSAFTNSMAHATAFGSRFLGPGDELDIEANLAGTYGGDSGSGSHHIAISAYDALSLELSELVTAGETYTLSFLARRVGNASYGSGPLNFGFSYGSQSFGKHAHTSGQFTDEWELHTVEFEAQVSGAYLTIHGSSNAGGRNSWIHLDAVSLVRVVPAPGAAVAFAAAGVAGLRRRR